MSKEERLLAHVKLLPQEQLRDSPEAVLAAIDEFDKKEPLMTIGKYKGELILQQMLEAKPVVMMELGGYVGYLAVLFGLRLAQINSHLQRSDKPSKYYSFEANAEYAKIAQFMIDLAGISDTVEIIVGKAADTLKDFERRLVNENGKYAAADFVFIDHWKDLYVPDLRVLESLGLVRPGTVICADNILRPGAPEYARYVQGTPQFRQEYNASHPNGDYLGRWNMIYDSKTVIVENPETGFKDGVEVTKVLEFLTG